MFGTQHVEVTTTFEAPCLADLIIVYQTVTLVTDSLSSFIIFYQFCEEIYKVWESMGELLALGAGFLET